ncbi:hypothetical protein H8E88_07660 [candidate division KSB1 bacterium]|nr:hypothetical protein [candidate division KSB1 bacterium]MBL7093276.1 hypothetical protein [candidate division KSB1 bacterium]
MKRYFYVFAFVLALSTMLIIGGCEKNSPNEPDETEITELDKPYGGYTTSDELPAFGDALLITEFNDDKTAADEVSTDPAFTAALDSQKVDAYFIRVVWGLLEFDSTATEVVDWSGSASVSKGVLGLTKIIRFEGPDRVVLPRTDLKTLEWQSQTIGHLDGLSFVILDRDSTDSEGLFTISTLLFERTFSYEELDSLEVVEIVTESGQQISIMSHKKEVIPFGGGFFDGRWVRLRKNGGEFKGRWINSLGTHAGHLRGIWGINSQDIKVYHGKYVTLNGQFGGLLSGNWGYAQDDTTKGWLEGRWVNQNLTSIGTMKGHWKTKADSDRHGFFHGKWRKTRP